MLRDREFTFLHTERPGRFERMEPHRLLFRPSPDKGLLWLQRLIFRLLCWFNCYSIREGMSQYVNSVQIRVDSDKFMSALWEQHQEILELYHHNGERVFIGRQDYMRMVGECTEYPDMFSFTGEYHCGSTGNPTTFGMRVTVIPWMSGVLVVPKIDDCC